MLAFFFSSSGLSRLFARRKSALNEKFSKGGRRDWAQVLANGGLGMGLIVAQVLLPDQTWPWWAYAGAIAAVNADTWGTELGVLSPTRPRLIASGKPVESGTSGGVSLWGTLASLGGGAFIGVFAALPLRSGWALPLGVVALAGLAGALFDSWLGATVQAIYTCPACGKETERHPFHTCGTATRQMRGWRWLNNDWVNFMASVAGAAVAVGLAALVF